MATRTNDLTEYAKPIADELARRCGSLKRILSAFAIVDSAGAIRKELAKNHKRPEADRPESE